MPPGMQPPRAPQVPTAKIISIVGSRDGVGKTTFATNVAISFLRETRGRVLLIDLDQNFCGDCRQLLGLPDAKTLVDLAPNLERLDPNLLRGIPTPHPGSGLQLLQYYRNRDDMAKLSPDLFAKALDGLSPIFDYIIIDGGTVLNNVLVKGLERSSIIFIMATADLMVLNQTRVFIDSLQKLHFPKEMLKVILNAYEQRNAIPLEMVTQKLQRQILTTVVRDDALAREGTLNAAPFVLSQPRSVLTKNYDDFVKNLVERKFLEQMSGLVKPRGVQVDEANAGGMMSSAGLVGDKNLPASQQQKGAKGRRTRALDPATEARGAIKRAIHKRLIEVLDLKKLDQELKHNEDRNRILRERTEKAVITILDEEGAHITSRDERGRITKEVLDEALGLGPLEDLLSEEAVSEIMVCGKDMVYVERGGRLTMTDITFTDDSQLLGVIERIVAPLGRRIDEKSPMVDARLKDGSRVNAIIPPLAIDGAALTIRKFSKDPLQVKDLVKFGSMTDEIADFLRACVEAHLNCLISGGTGSGKTTLLNVLSSFIPSHERIITVEDSAELQLHQPHVVRLETRPANIEGEGEITIRDLVKNTLRMRPDRIVVGECRGAEALDMLQAMNTGHDGSLTTIHSNSPRDCIARLETLVMFAGLDLPSKAIREQIAAAIHVIVQQSRLNDGSRKITAISEVTGMEGQTITLQDIFIYKQTGVNPDTKKAIGKFIPTGFIPKFVETLEAKGIKIPKGMFKSAL